MALKSRVSSLEGLKSIIVMSFLLTCLLSWVAMIRGQYNLFGYLTGMPGALDDLINPVISAATYGDVILSSQILQLSSFNTPFSPLSYTYARTLDLFFFSPISNLINISTENDLNLLLIILMSIFVVLCWISLYKLSLVLYPKRRTGISFLFFFFPPIIFGISRGNPVILMLTIFSATLLLLQIKRYSFAFVLLAFMASFQFPYVIFFLLILGVHKDRLRLSLIYFFTLTTLTFLPWFFSAEGFLKSFETFSELNSRWYSTYVIHNEGLLHGVSFLGFEKGLLFLSNSQGIIDFIYSTYAIQIIGVIVLCVFGVGLTIIGEYRESKFIYLDQKLLPLVLTIALVVFPQVTAIYKEAFLLPSLLYLGEKKLDFLLRSLYVRLLLLLIFAIVIFPHWTLKVYQPGISFDSFVDPVCLLLLLLFISKNYRLLRSLGQ